MNELIKIISDSNILNSIYFKYGLLLVTFYNASHAN